MPIVFLCMLLFITIYEFNVSITPLIKCVLACITRVNNKDVLLFSKNSKVILPLYSLSEWVNQLQYKHYGLFKKVFFFSIIHGFPRLVKKMKEKRKNERKKLAELERVRTRTRTQGVSPSPSPDSSPDSDPTLVDSDSDSDSTSVDSDSSAVDSDSGLMDSDSDSDSTQVDSDSQWVQVSPVRNVQG